MKRKKFRLRQDWPMTTYDLTFDPFGSYTGQPLDPEDKPVQDADDL